jgi:DNA-directed RNA polymerase
MPIRKAKGKGKASKEPAPELSEARNRAEEMERKAEAKARELAEVEELERKLNQWAVSARPELVQDNSEARVYGDVQRSVRCYLEACVFCGDIDRAHRFLLSHHRMVSRRNLLNIGLYNIMMRVWAKKVSAAQCFISMACRAATLWYFTDLYRNYAGPPHVEYKIILSVSLLVVFQGSLNQIGRMFILIEEAGLKPNLGSYCAALECMGRNPDCSPHVINR